MIPAPLALHAPAMILLAGGSGLIPRPDEGLTPRAVVFEPCRAALDAVSASPALERLAAERSVAFAVEDRGTVEAWLELVEHPPEALYLETVGDSANVVVACYGLAAARKLALDAAAADPRARALPWVQRRYVTEHHDAWVLALPKERVAESLRGARELYEHRHNGPPWNLRPGVDAAGAEPIPLVNHLGAAQRFFYDVLGRAPNGAGSVIDALEARAPRPPTGPSEPAPSQPSADLVPRLMDLVLPASSMPITLRNTGGLPLLAPIVEPLFLPPGLTVEPRWEAPAELLPGQEILVLLDVRAERVLEPGEHRVVIGLHAGLPEGGAIDVPASLRVYVDEPPQLSAPSSFELTAETAVEIQARDDSDDQATHIEALVPPGVELEHLEPGRVRLRRASSDTPAPGDALAVIFAWSGGYRDVARGTVHELTVLATPPSRVPWIVLGAYGAVTTFAIGVGMYARRRLRPRRPPP